MVVTCESCQTRFQLDESRIPERGIRVRCSRCKTAFFLPHPSASEEASIHDAAAEASDSGTSSPGSTQDLAVPAASGGGDVESDWEFNEQPAEENLAAAPEPEPEPELGEDEAGIEVEEEEEEDLETPSGLDLASDSEPVETEASDGDLAIDTAAHGQELTGPDPREQATESLSEGGAELAESPGEDAIDSDLGNPEDWDFFSDESLESEAAAEAVPSVEIPEVEPAPAVESPVEPAFAPETTDGWLGHVVSGVGWTVVAALLGFGLYVGLQPPGVEAIAPSRPQVIGGLRVEAISWRWLDTAHHGKVLALSGRFRNMTADFVQAKPMQVALYQRDGTRLSQLSAWVATGIAPDAIRQLEPEPLAEAVEQGARALWRTPVPSRGHVPFVALLEHVPPAAERARLEVVAAPEDMLEPEAPETLEPEAETETGAEEPLEPA